MGTVGWLTLVSTVLGPAVQSIVNLTKSLRHQLIRYMPDYIFKYAVFFFSQQKILTFFSNKKAVYLIM